MIRRRLGMIPLVFALVAALSPAGTGEAAQQGPTTNRSGGITFEHASIVDPVRLDGEPDLAVGPDGSIYVSAPGSSAQQRSDFWKSEDGGYHWHNIGVVPEVKSNGGLGGGDTELAVDRTGGIWGMDQEGLACNAMFHSSDGGKTFSYSQGCVPGTDRPWMFTYTDAAGQTTGYFAANGQVGGCYFLSSTDGLVWRNPNGGLTGGPGGSCIGRGVVDQRNGTIYIPTSSGVKKSTDGGKTWTSAGDSGARGGAGTAGFGTLQIDSQGNLYQVWTELSKGIHVAISRDGAMTWEEQPLITVPNLKSYIFGWPVVGDPGRIAVAFYGTPTPNDPTAQWRTYVSVSTNALDDTPKYVTTLADDHVMHVGTVCLQGTACALSATSVNGDRTLADFFMIDKDPRNGRLFIVYNDDGDQSPVTQKGQSYVAVIRQRTGPSLLASVGEVPPPTTAEPTVTSQTVTDGQLVVSGAHGLPPGNFALDGAGDAVEPWAAGGPNVPALDLREATVSEAGGNLTFTLKLADLSTQAQATADQAIGNPSWVVTWWERTRNADGSLGPQAHYFVKWLGGSAFVYGKTNAIDMPQLGAPAPKVVLYPPAGQATGTQTGNTVSVTVPLSALGNLRSGDKIDNVTAWTWAERGTFPGVIDQAKSFSYVIGTPATAQHAPDGYVQVSVDDPTFANPVLATLQGTNGWTATLGSVVSGAHTVYVRQVLSAGLYNGDAWDDVVAGPVATATLTVQ